MMVEQITDKSGGEQLNREELIQLGIQTAKSGQAQNARIMFRQVLGEDPRNERALLWMAYLTPDKAEKRRYLLKVLKVNNNNQTARRELQRMAHDEKARSNRTLILGGVAIIVVVLVIVLVVVVAVAASGGI